MERIDHEVRRFSTSIAKEILEDAPLLVIQGARQVGKSTLLRQSLSDEEALFTTLDHEATRSFAESDPQGFLDQAGNRTLVIDEAQRLPQLALALKAAIDQNRRPGRFAITGSADLLNIRGVSDSLAGRAESLTVRPLSQGEITEKQTPEDWVDWILSVDTHPDPFIQLDGAPVHEEVVAGGYPEALKRPTPRRAQRWFDSYTQRLSRHDAQELQAGDFPLYLDGLLRLLASQGQAELVKAKMARSLGISESTVRDYLELAETMFLTQSLPSWGRGISGRVVRRPKVALLDTGMAAAMTDFTTEKSRLTGGQEFYGALLEAFVAGELFKQQAWSQRRFRLFHLRERETEIDIVIELADGRLILVEVKSARDPDARAWRNLVLMQRKLDERVAAAVVLHQGSAAHTVAVETGKVTVLPVRSLWEHP